MFFCLCSGYRIEIIDGLFFFIHHTLIYMWRLYYITSVYLKSFKELNSRFRSESVCKVKGFIFNNQTFSKVFLKKFFLSENQDSLSRSLATTREDTKKDFQTNHKASNMSTQTLSLSKADAKVQTFLFNARLLLVLFTNFYNCKTQLIVLQRNNT